VGLTQASRVQGDHTACSQTHYRDVWGCLCLEPFGDVHCPDWSYRNTSGLLDMLQLRDASQAFDHVGLASQMTFQVTGTGHA
jgi:hypothetical protein